MNIFTKISIVASTAALFLAAPAVASAERIYFLVGTRHVYRIGPNQYFHVDERKKIEEDYADQVAADQDTYNKAIANGADASIEGPQFNSALNDLAAERDQRLSALYENADYERERHPQLRIEGEGPYQVIGINFHYHNSVEVFDNFIVYAPWPGYVVVDRPYGWSYGVVYTPGVFFNVYLGWHSHIFLGGPVFYGFYGHHGAWGALPIYRGVHGGYAVHTTVGRVMGRPGGYSGSHYYGGTRTTTGYRYSTSHSSFGGSHYTTGHTTTKSRYTRTNTSTHSSFGSRTIAHPAPRSNYVAPRAPIAPTSRFSSSHSSVTRSRYSGGYHSSFGSSSHSSMRGGGSFGSHSSSFGGSRTSTHSSGGGRPH
jgi:hypothetical protein